MVRNDPYNPLLEYKDYNDKDLDRTGDLLDHTGTVCYIDARKEEDPKILHIMLYDAQTLYKIGNKREYYGSHILRKILNWPHTSMQTSSPLFQDEYVKLMDAYKGIVREETTTTYPDMEKGIKEATNIANAINREFRSSSDIKAIWDSDYTYEDIRNELIQLRNGYVPTRFIYLKPIHRIS